MSLHTENAATELQSPDFLADEAIVDAGSESTVESTVDSNGFAALNLNASLLKAVDALGYTEPTAVQAETIPAALAGGDWMVSSQTGSGKTAAFLLPALQVLLETPPMPKGEQIARSRRAGASPRVLVLCPTRELAQQVAQEAIRLVRFVKGVRIANVVGGTPFGKQLMELRGASLVVATPGRLLDLNRNGQIGLDCVQTLVVDEADRMLDLGFSEDLEAIHVATARRDRTLMFSATFAPRIMELASHVMREPQKIELATAQDTHENIEQRLHWFDDMAHKNALLEHYLQDESMEQAVVFTATQIETDELADELREAGYAASALHGAMPQTLRNRRIKSMRDGTIKVLIATDVAARGIDVPTITHVINYGLPMKPEDYVHRIGRTGRAGRSGLAITLAGFRDRFKIRNIEHFTQQRIGEAVVEGHEPRSKPPSTGGYGGGFGGGRGGYGGRGGDRGFGGGFGGGQGARGRLMPRRVRAAIAVVAPVVQASAASVRLIARRRIVRARQMIAAVAASLTTALIALIGVIVPRRVTVNMRRASMRRVLPMIAVAPASSVMLPRVKAACRASKTSARPVGAQSVGIARSGRRALVARPAMIVRAASSALRTPAARTTARAANAASVVLSAVNATAASVVIAALAVATAGRLRRGLIVRHRRAVDSATSSMRRSSVRKPALPSAANALRVRHAVVSARKLAGRSPTRIVRSGVATNRQARPTPSQLRAATALHVAQPNRRNTPHAWRASRAASNRR